MHENITTPAATTMHGPAECRIVELRRYALRPGQRDALIELFDREFVETQEAVGMSVLGQFRDLDDPDSFVWLRGFVDMETRKAALESFYGGPVWRRHARAANATMVNSDNVLLLRPVAGLEHAPARRPAPGATAEARGMVAITIWPLAPDSAAKVASLVRTHFEPALRAVGVSLLAAYESEHSENTFPALPVREDANVVVSLALHADEDDHTRFTRDLERSRRWRAFRSLLAPSLVGTEETLRLRPTARSALHH